MPTRIHACMCIKRKNDLPYVQFGYLLSRNVNLLSLATMEATSSEQRRVRGSGCCSIRCGDNALPWWWWRRCWWPLCIRYSREFASSSCDDGEDGGGVSPWQLTAAAAAAGLPLDSRRASTSPVTSSLTSSESLRVERLRGAVFGLADEHVASITQVWLVAKYARSFIHHKTW